VKITIPSLSDPYQHRSHGNLYSIDITSHVCCTSIYVHTPACVHFAHCMY